MIVKTYNDENTAILSFMDSKIRYFGIPLIVQNSKISCSCSKQEYNRAFSINNVNGKHTINIVWNRITMTKPIEVFDLHIKYDGKIRITEKVRLEYPLSDINFDVKLSKKSGIWGIQPNTDLIVSPKFNNSDAWKYKEKTVNVSFKKGDVNYFFPIDDKNTFSFNAKKGTTIPLKFFFKDEPITERTRFSVSFSLDGISKHIDFYFDPYPIQTNSYVINIERLVKEFEYGTYNKPIFIVEVKQANDFVVPAKIEKITFTNASAPFVYQVQNGKHFIVMDVSNLKWVERDTKYEAKITLNNSNVYHKEVYICVNETSNSNEIRLKPGQKPVLRLLPSNRVEVFLEEKNKEIGLEISNVLSSPITISKIKTIENSFNIISKPIYISGGDTKVIPIKVEGQTVGNKPIKYIVQTKETGEAQIELNLSVKQKQEQIITPEFFINENYDLILKEGFDHEENCGTILIKTDNKALNRLSFIEADFKLNDDNFKIASSSIIDDNNYCYDIVVNEGAFSDINKMPCPIEKEGHTYYPLAWEYHGQKNNVLVEMKKPSYYILSLSKVNKIIFPLPDENRKIFLCNIEVQDRTPDCCILDEDQNISVQSPLFFVCNNEECQSVDLTEHTKLALFIDINKVGQVNNNTLNIESPISVPVEILRNSKRKGEYLKHYFTFPIEPIVAKPKGRVYFIYDNDKEKLLYPTRMQNVELTIYEQSEDVLAVNIGSVCFRNNQRIPYCDKALRCVIQNIAATIDHFDILHENSKQCIGNHIEIANGEKDIMLPVYLDYQSWKNFMGSPICLSVEIKEECDNSSMEPIQFQISIEVSHIFIDDVYALDLGTTGIVVAKERNGEQEIVELEDDKDDPIEEDSKIISSQTMLIAGRGTDSGKIYLSPSGHEYYGRTEINRFRLVPSKFIIGQERIPYLQDFYSDDELSKTVELFESGNIVNLTVTNNSRENEDKISSLIGALYKGIFARCSNETKSIKKLVVTYPNTYTIENLDSIKTILQEKLSLNLNGQVTFVPESDAVAAYYFDQKIMNEGGFLDENGNPKKEVNVVIYDMGAGTLDLSLISFRYTLEDSITASIVSKIGVPLAGNYLNYIIYKTLLDKGIVQSENEIDDNTIKDLTEGIKHEYNTNDEKIADLRPNWYTMYQNILDVSKIDTYQGLFENEMDAFFTCCSKTILQLLNPNNTKIDTIVFSGRASKFSSLREKVIEALNEQQKGESVNEDVLLPIGNCGDHLKTCVAIGALKYQSFFNSDGPFRIENKNIYSKISVVYWGKNKTGGYGVCVKTLIDPQTENWEDAELINGTWCKEFTASENISGHLTGKFIYYIQTNLNDTLIQELFKKVYLNNPSRNDDLNWAFVNILYKKRITDSKPFDVSLRISKDNKIIDRRIGSLMLNDKKLLENVEDNILYKRSMWPFITQLTD